MRHANMSNSEVSWSSGDHKQGRIMAYGPLVIAVTLVVIRALATPDVALAVTPPPFTQSRYVTDLSTSNMYNMGCWEAKRQPGVYTAAILDFGDPKRQSSASYGATTADYHVYYTTSQIRDAVVTYARGYNYCAGGYFIWIAAGVTNNYSVNGLTAYSAHAQAWANMVENINSDLQQQDLLDKAKAVGGIDAEPAWSTKSSATTWVNAWDDAADQLDQLWNFGTADGCSETAHNNTNCANGWKQYDVWRVSWGPPGTLEWPFPEIYRTGTSQCCPAQHSKQWKQISLYGVYNQSGKLLFKSTLSQWQACIYLGSPPSCATDLDITPGNAYTQLWNHLNLYGDTSAAMTPQYSSDISWLMCPDDDEDCDLLSP